MAMTVLINATETATKRDLALAMSEHQMMEAAAEHIYGKVFCDRYASDLLDGTGPEHAEWIAVLRDVATERGISEAFNAGFKLATERLKATTGE